MSRDFAKTSRSRKRSQTTRRASRNAGGGKFGGLFWFVSGAALGALMTSLILTPAMRSELSGSDSENTVGGNEASGQKPRFDFYKLLSENEVVVADEEPEASPVSNRPQTDNQPVEQSIYLLQAGSFKNAGDADSLRAQLLLMNMNASIEKAKTASGDRWYRVMVGPFDGRDAMTRTRGRLASNGIETLALKRKK